MSKKLKSHSRSMGISRRTFVKGAAAGTGVIMMTPYMVGCGDDTTSKTHRFAIEIEDNELAPNGVMRSVRTYNGTVPGPVIEANLGDIIEVEATNKMKESTTVHWHGMYQIGTNDQDGVNRVTQGGIPTGSSQTYRFAANPAGTHWYHSHHGEQYADGLFGALIVHDPAERERWQWDSEQVVVLGDWFNQTASDIMSGLKANTLPDSRPLSDVKFDSFLLNGAGTADATDAGGGSYGRLKGTPGHTLRLRLINASSNFAILFSIDNHPLRVIASDGHPIEETTTDAVRIDIGGRYDVLVELNQSTASYWMRTASIKKPANDPAFFQGLGILEYEGATSSVPDEDAGDFPEKLAEDPPYSLTIKNSETQMVPSPDQNVEIKFGKHPSEYVWTLNGVSFPNKDASFTVKKGDNVRVTLENPTMMLHPFHLHGHSFLVLGLEDNLNTTNPPRKDTVAVPPGVHKDGMLEKSTKVVIQFLADNPGNWIFHCHIDFHLGTGMAQVVHYDEVAEWDPDISGYK